MNQPSAPSATVQCHAQGSGSAAGWSRVCWAVALITRVLLGRRRRSFPASGARGVPSCRIRRSVVLGGRVGERPWGPRRADRGHWLGWRRGIHSGAAASPGEAAPASSSPASGFADASVRAGKSLMKSAPGTSGRVPKSPPGARARTAEPLPSIRGGRVSDARTSCTSGRWREVPRARAVAEPSDRPPDHFPPRSHSVSWRPPVHREPREPGPTRNSQTQQGYFGGQSAVEHLAVPALGQRQVGFAGARSLKSNRMPCADSISAAVWAAHRPARVSWNRRPPASIRPPPWGFDPASRYERHASACARSVPEVQGIQAATITAPPATRQENSRGVRLDPFDPVTQLIGQFVGLQLVATFGFHSHPRSGFYGIPTAGAPADHHTASRRLGFRGRIEEV